MKKTKRIESRLEKALNEFVTAMNGQTFSDNKSYRNTLEKIAKVYFDYAFELGYERGCEETHKEHVAYIIDGEKVRY